MYHQSHEGARADEQLWARLNRSLPKHDRATCNTAVTTRGQLAWPPALTTPLKPLVNTGGSSRLADVPR